MHMHRLPEMRSIKPVMRSFGRNSSEVLSFQFLLGDSFIGLPTENPLYSHKPLIKILSSKLNVFHFIALLLTYYYVRSNSMKLTLQCM